MKDEGGREKGWGGGTASHPSRKKKKNQVELGKPGPFSRVDESSKENRLYRTPTKQRENRGGGGKAQGNREDRQKNRKNETKLIGGTCRRNPQG